MKKLTASLIFGLFAAISLTLTIACLFVQPCSETINNDRTFAALFVLSCLFIYLFLKSENKKKKSIYSHLWIVCFNHGEFELVKYDEYKTGWIHLIGTIEEANKFYFENYIQNLS